MTKPFRSLAKIALALTALFIMGCTMNLAVGDAARSSLSSFLSGLASQVIDQTVNPQH